MTEQGPSAWLARVREKRRTATNWAGAALLVVGASGAVASMALRGASSAWLAQAWTLALIALLGWAALTLPERRSARIEHAVMLLMWVVAALVLANMVLNWVDLDAWAWRAPSYFPFTVPIGTDFRLGGYEAAETFSTAISGWPPLTVILFLPYLLLDQNTAYVVHVVVLLALNVAAIRLAVYVARRSVPDSGTIQEDPWYLAVGRLAPVLSIWLFASFGFLLSIERGSIDAFVVFFAILGLASIIGRPHDVWTPTIMFALAAQLKVYPAALLALIIWRFRWKAVVPIVVVNAALALIAGPRNLVLYLGHMNRAVSNGASWVGNQSAMSFSWWTTQAQVSPLSAVPRAALLAIPVVIFALTAARLWKRSDDASTVLMACALFPVMCLVPSISHDYKTVILAAPVLLLMALVIRGLGEGSEECWWMLSALAIALFFIGRAPGNLLDYGVPSQQFVWPFLLMNKYLPILLVQVVAAWMAWRLPAPTTAVAGQT